MLDSDERPAQAFLDHISAIIDEATARNLTALPHVTRVHLGNGGHFVPDQYGTALGHAIRGWLGDHGLGDHR